MTTSLPDPTISTEARQPFNVDPYITRPTKVDPFATQPIKSVMSAQFLSDRKGQQKWLKLALRTGVTLLLLYFLVKSLSWSTLLTTLLHANQMALIMGLALGVLC